jgi:hypothetical protein
MGNYNLKNIMLGIGIGLIFSSMLNISMSSKEMTVEEIKKEAERYNLIVLTKEEIMNNPAPTEEPTTAPTPAPTAVPAPTVSVVPTNSPSPTPKSVTSDKIIKITVESGMSSEDISTLLAEAGVLKDKKAFMKRLGELGVDSRLKIGSFEIPKGSGYDDIIKILTR